MKKEDFVKATEIQLDIKQLDDCIKGCEKDRIWHECVGRLTSVWYDSERPSTATVEIPSTIFHDVVVFLRNTAIKKKEVYEQMFQNL